MKNILFLLAILISLIVTPVFGDSSSNENSIDITSGFIKESYIVTFKEGTSVIDSPNEANHSNVPFGEHNSGQSKEEFIIELGIVGEVVSIYDTINAAHIRMTAEQAYILSLDERVLHIEQDRITTSVVQNPIDLDKVIEPFTENPSYQDGIITIPIIDTLEQTGMFQDVTLQLTEQGECQILDFKTSGTASLNRKLYVETAELIVTESFPVQAFLKVNGSLSDGCMTMGKVSQRLVGNHFEVLMFAENTTDPSTHTCTDIVTDFEKIIPLPVYGLSAGAYEYSLGNVLTFSTSPPSEKTFTGTFELAQDNALLFETED